MKASYWHHLSECDIVDRPSPNSRQTFHPIYELPMMRDWYRDCPNPTNDDFRRYLDELNSAPVRQERPRVHMRRLKIWWKNEKQRLRKQQQRELEKSTGEVDESFGDGGRERNQDSSGEGTGLDVTAELMETMIAAEEGGGGADRSPTSEAKCGIVEQERKKTERRRGGGRGSRGARGSRGGGRGDAKVARLPSSRFEPSYSITHLTTNATASNYQAISKTFSGNLSGGIGTGSAGGGMYAGGTSVGYHHDRFGNDRPRSREDAANMERQVAAVHGHNMALGGGLQELRHAGGGGIGNTTVNAPSYHMADSLYSPVVFHMPNLSHPSPG